MYSLRPLHNTILDGYSRLRGIAQKEINATAFVLLFTLANTLLYHRPLFVYTVTNLDPWSFNGLSTMLVLAMLLFSVTAFVLLVMFALSRRIGMLICALMLLANSVAHYFIATYQVILDKSMMGNVMNTRFSEASEFFESGLLLSILLLGVIPCWLLYQVRIRPVKRLWLALQAVLVLGLGIGSFAVATNTWLWIDEHSKQVGGVMLPWAYVGNGASQLQLAAKDSVEDQLLLPPAVAANDDRLLVVLVIGETARAANFSFYGYSRQTNPIAASLGVIALANATSCSTYTTASLRCILSHDNTGGLFADDYELLPSYLQRHGVNVIWRSKNWGEPPIRVASYKTPSDLEKDCRVNCKFDEILLTGLAAEIDASPTAKTFVVLHQKGSHGPKYSKRYPPEFALFQPVCTSVELQDCSNQALVNAYDNSLVYTDYFLGQTIKLLQQFDDRPTVLLYISDHGESLGESGLYLHGAPYAIAPAVQKEIPFFTWLSDRFLERKGLSAGQLQQRRQHSQDNIFHSVMGAFDMRSEVYVERLDIFNANVSVSD